MGQAELARRLGGGFPKMQPIACHKHLKLHACWGEPFYAFFIDQVVCILQEIQYTNKLGSPDSDPDKLDLQCGCVWFICM